MLSELLETLCGLDGVSGREDAIRNFVISRLGGRPYTVDPLGNLIVEAKGKKPAKNRVMVTAHMDEVGIIATFVREDGLICFTPVGGVMPGVLTGRAVRFENGVRGVIGLPPVHLCKPEEKKQLPDLKSLTVDIGCDSAEEAGKLVRPGDTAVFDVPFVKLGGRALSKAIDDRAGVAVMLDMLEEGPAYDAVFCFNVQEEVGLRGAAASAYTAAPDYAIVLEATTAADLIDTPPEKRVCELGRGVAVSFMDRRTVYDKTLYDRTMALAAERGIPAQPKTAVAGGNDAGAIHVSRGGVKTLTLSLPCRYIHSPSGVCELKDLESLRQLAGAMLAEFADG